MIIEIKKGLPSGTFVAPPSKSYAHRQLICAALSHKGCCVSNIHLSDDIKATLSCLDSLGFKYEYKRNKVTFFRSNISSQDKSTFLCNESGSTLRFFIPIALTLGGVNEFCGTQKLISRGIDIYDDICKENGIKVTHSGEKIVFEGKLKPGVFKIRGDISSQFITGLFFALPLLDGDSEIIVTTNLESRPYVDISLDVLSKYGIQIKEKESNHFYIQGNQKYKGVDTKVEGDYSNAAFLDAFSLFSKDISVKGLNKDSRQGDRIYIDLFEKIRQGYVNIDVSECPDLAPILFALSGVFHGGHFEGTRRLRIKESDRCESMKEELSKFGINLSIGDNYVDVEKIDGPIENKKITKQLNSHNDHRIAMSLSVLSTLCGASICGAECVKKSFPSFFDVLKNHGVKIRKLD